MIRTWQEHTTSSIIVNHTERKNISYSSYLNMNCDKINMILTVNVLGVFQYLSQAVGIWIYKTKKEDTNKILHWSEGELSELHLLSDSVKLKDIEGKRYNYLCYLFESVYALSI